MGTIIQLMKRAGSVLMSLPKWRNTSFETYCGYDRNDGKHVEFVVIHLPHASGDVFSEPHLVLTSRSIRRNPNMTPQSLLSLTMEEARLLRNFLNREEVGVWLDEEEDEA